jgi:hypothetical protein
VRGEKVGCVWTNQFELDGAAEAGCGCSLGHDLRSCSGDVSCLQEVMMEKEKFRGMAKLGSKW